MADWLQSKIVRLGELSNIEEKKTILSDIKIKLGNLNNRETEQISRNVDFNQLFTQLTSNDRYHNSTNFIKLSLTFLRTGELFFFGFKLFSLFSLIRLVA